MSRASKGEPTTRAGILAAGLVRVVKTPAQLDAEGGWWTPEKPHSYPADVRRARRDGLAAGLPKWLRPPVTPKQAVARMFKDAEGERRAACVYLGGKTYTPPSSMTPAQLRAALNAQFRRLSGGWNDAGKGLDIEVEAAPPVVTDTATIEMLGSVPEPVEAPAPITQPAPIAEPVSPAVAVPAAPERLSAPEPPRQVPARLPVPRPAPIATPRAPQVPAKPPQAPRPVQPASGKPKGRDRLAWVPVMQRLAGEYAQRGLPAPRGQS